MSSPSPASATPGFRHLAGHLGFLLGMLLLAANMRGAIVVLGPLAEVVSGKLQLSGTALGLLTTIPVLCFGLLSVTAARLGRRYGLERILLASVLFVALGQALRTTGVYSVMLGGTVIVGAAIAVMNVLTPALVRRSFASHLPLVTGLYTFVMSGGAALAAFSAVPVMQMAGGDWRWSLGMWSALAGLTLLLCLPMLRYEHHTVNNAAPSGSLWRNSDAWWLALMFGCQSMLFYTGTAWIAKIFIDLGSSETEAGALLTVFNMLGIPAALVAPVIYSAIGNKKLAMLLLHLPLFVGVFGFAFAPLQLPYVWMTCFGIGQGTMIALVLTLIGARGADPQTSASLSGMCQSFGYLLAACGPMLFGVLHDFLGDWQIPLYLFVVMLLTQFVAALKIASDRPIRLSGPAA
ncbi:MFS transporter [Granulosicoccaceae sp. 1_MG-2023]|nr:MFS transporter [Granulosicoccaceae sp. 1_MG-2023]